MSRFATALSMGIIVTVLGSGAAPLMRTPAEAAIVSKADKVALKTAIVACKGQARGEKVKWLSRRKYVNQCVAEALKGRPNIDVDQLLKSHPDMKDLPKEQWDAN